MLRKIGGTFVTRLVCALLTFVIIIINSNSFGAEGTGAISKFVLTVSILQMLSSFVGGPSLVYMLPRHNNFQLILLSYLFSLITNSIGVVVLSLIGLISLEHIGYLLVISVFFVFYYINSLVILSRENIGAYNLLAIIQIFIHFATLLFCLFVLDNKNISAYIYAYGLSYIIVFLISLFWIFGKIPFRDAENIFSLFRKMFCYGVVIQGANLAQLLNYRLGYYIIDILAGQRLLGLFDLGTKLSEAIWIFPKSISTVQYARISNCDDSKPYAKKITLAFFKITGIFAFCATVCLISIPASWLGRIFGDEYSDAKRVLYALALGIILLACNIILANYFSGLGKYRVNTIGSFLGLIVTGVCSIVLICFHRLFSTIDIIFFAGLIACLSYTASFIYSFLCFRKDTKLTVSELIINRQDISFLQNILSSLRKTNRN
jgi:O-antigen/teichoic acid export membrane protein